ncbi:VWA domain-containing protein [Marinomonas sp. THO17]|uniref:VWA domain-containing protein n=1 Tax=Marinomonas sp. THO17 TaxID=3149048 RepID=UPI00336BEAB6
MTLFDSLHFDRPEWLVLIPISLLAMYFFHAQQDQQKKLNNLVDSHLLPYLQEKQNIPSLNKWLGLFSILLCWLGIAGISWQKTTQPMYLSSEKTVIVVDQSLSMYATDIQPNRQTQLKQTVRDILSSSKGGDIALVAYAGDSYVISPFTQDRDTITHFLLALEPIIMPIYGNNLADAIDTAIKLNKSDSVLHLIVLTDDISAQDEVRIPELLKDQDVRLNLIAIGTPQGGTIKLPNGRLLKRANQTIIPQTPIKKLRGFTQSLNGHFYHGRLTNKELQKINQTFDSQDNREKADNQGITWQDQGHWFAIPLLIWLAYQFRRGVLFLLLVGILNLPSKPLMASPLNWFRTQDQKAQQLVDQGNWQAASELFERPDWQAASAYALEQYSDTIEHLESLERNASDNYNLGNAYALSGQSDKAIQAYEAALKQDPELTVAKQNLDYLKAQQKEQQQNSRSQQNTPNPSPQKDQDSKTSRPSESQAKQESQPEETINKNNETQDKSDSAEDNTSKGDQETQSQLESQQALEQWLRQIQDNPGSLLQRKLEYLHQEKRDQNILRQEDGMNPW